MKQHTKAAFSAYKKTICELNGIDNIAEKFTVAPSVSQKLEDRIQQSVAFLKDINVVPVAEQSGQVIGLTAGSTIAGTTDTKSGDRTPTDPTLLDAIEYKCEQTNYDTAVPYQRLDMWAKFPDFQKRMRNSITHRQALDRIMIGFNGERREKQSDRTANPLLQDVNIGWLQKIRNDAPEHVMGGAAVKSGEFARGVTVGAGGVYANLDALVMDVVDSIIDPVYQDDTQLVVICGRSLLADKYFPLVNKVQENSEQLAADSIVSQKRIGGLQAVRAPYFPANAILITRLDNLSIYWQEGSRRRHVIDNPKRDQIENFESVNESYVIEDYRGVALIENITIAAPAAAAEHE